MPTIGTPAPPAPSTDKRQKMLEATIRKHGRSPQSLIEVLHTAQELFGHLSPQLLRYVSHAIDVPPSKVYGVATFYHFFTLAPKGKHTCTVCLGTACFVKHAAELVAAVEGAFDVKVGAMTQDGNLSLNVARCVGSCGLAPVVLVDDLTIAKAEPNVLLQRIHAVTTDAKGAT